MTSITFKRLGPSTETKSMTAKSVGKVITISVKRMRMSSQRPPRYPDVMPIKRPTTEEIRAAMVPTVSEILAAKIIRANTSRPPASVPRMCSKTGTLVDTMKVDAEVVLPGDERGEYGH